MACIGLKRDATNDLNVLPLKILCQKLDGEPVCLLEVLETEFDIIPFDTRQYIGRDVSSSC